MTDTKSANKEWEGKRVKVIRMDDPIPVEPGEIGTVLFVDTIIDIVSVRWDNGRTLSLICDVDDFEILD